jgi:hypothetical protein
MVCQITPAIAIITQYVAGGAARGTCAIDKVIDARRWLIASPEESYKSSRELMGTCLNRECRTDLDNISPRLSITTTLPPELSAINHPSRLDWTQLIHTHAESPRGSICIQRTA